jgi:hypothetical protein
MLAGARTAGARPAAVALLLTADARGPASSDRLRPSHGLPRERAGPAKLQLLSIRRCRSPSEWPPEPLLLQRPSSWPGCHEPPSGRPRNPIGADEHLGARSNLQFRRGAVSGRIPTSPAILCLALVQCPGEGRGRSSRHELRKLQGVFREILDSDE